MIDPYLALKWVHILSSTLLFGTGIGTAFQLVWAMHTGRVETLHSVASGVVLADWLFTVPSGIVQPLSGLLLVRELGLSPMEPFLIVSYALYIVAFLCWLPVVRLQINIRDLAGEALANGTTISGEIRRLFRIWFLLGWPAFLSLVAVFWLMISKPTLWG